MGDDRTHGMTIYGQTYGKKGMIDKFKIWLGMLLAMANTADRQVGTSSLDWRTPFLLAGQVQPSDAPFGKNALAYQGGGVSQGLLFGLRLA